MTEPWLVVIDMQVVFAEEGSPWATPGYAAIEPTVQRLVEHFGERVVFTRYIAPEHPSGAWVPYFELWPFALVPPDDRLYDLMPAFAGEAKRVVTATTFGKWGDELASILGPDPTMILAGVSTDCCVISTALAAADAGVAVRVVADGCAGLSEADHDRALAAMSLYGPLIEIITADQVLHRP
ncbi:cysteine hydrolase family protein [Schumannella luteola]